MNMQSENWKRLMINGSVFLYNKQSFMEKDISKMETEGFETVQFDCSGWDEAVFHKEVARKLDFPAYYGENLDAFNDCLSELEMENTGILLVFHHFPAFLDKYPELAISLLTIIQVNSWRFLLDGKGLVIFVQSDNPNLVLPPIGAMDPQWNCEEWFD